MSDPWARHYDPVDHAAAVKDLLHREHLLDRIHENIAQPTTAQELRDHRKVADASPAPWNARFALLLLDIEAGARSLEARLRYSLGIPWLPVEDPRGYRFARPAGRTSARIALQQTVILAEALNVRQPDHDVAREAQTTVEQWARRARAVLDEARPDEEPWSKCPGDLRCSVCESPLWLEPGWSADPNQASVYCRRCSDADGRMLSWDADTWHRVVNADLPAGTGN